MDRRKRGIQSDIVFEGGAKVSVMASNEDGVGRGMAVGVRDVEMPGKSEIGTKNMALLKKKEKKEMALEMALCQMKMQCSGVGEVPALTKQSYGRLDLEKRSDTVWVTVSLKKQCNSKNSCCWREAVILTGEGASWEWQRRGGRQWR